MALSVVIEPLNPTKEIGETQTFTATATGASEEGTLSYVWTVDDTTQDSVTNTLDVTESTTGAKVVKVVVTSTPETGDPETAEAQTTLTVTKKEMTLTCAIVSDKMTPKHGEQVKLTATATGIPSGSVSDYIWKLDGVAITDAPKTSTYSFIAGDIGTEKYTCTVEVTHADYDPETKTSNELSIVIGKATQTTLIVMEVSPLTVQVDEVLPAKVTVTNQPSGSVIKYEWFVDGEAIPDSNSPTYDFSKDTASDYDLKCNVSVTHANYVDFVQDTNTVTITVSESPIKEYDIYVHPLPWRSSAYIWCGWWVMDAIEHLTYEGKDWKKATEADSKYYKHLQVLAQMLIDYPEVDVQESRNGYIVHRSALEVGIIY